MTQRDKSPEGSADRPAVVLVRPQMGENIGAAARAMFNFGLTELRLVAPRDGWPNAKAEAMAAGALEVVQAAEIYPSTKEALADFNYVIATTARGREVSKPVMTPGRTAQELHARHGAGSRTALLFGAEASGLENDDVALADVMVTIPANPAFSSLNLGQAVLLLAYEWMRAGDETAPVQLDRRGYVPAPRGDLTHLFDHLEATLTRSGFLRPPEKAPVMMRNIKAMLTRADFSDQEVRTLRGIITSLERLDVPKN